MRLADHLPQDWRDASLIGRLMTDEGPTPILVRHGRVIDISRAAPTTSLALGFARPADIDGRDMGGLEELSFATAWGESGHELLSPLDLQCIKASGVTFAVSVLERVIEERARGDARIADTIRQALRARIGGELNDLRPGSPEAEAVKAQLISDGLWSQYLEVAIGPHAEIFTKAPVLASVGWGAAVGVRSDSTWNNPEPEVVIVCGSHGRPVGATLGNDVNLRDIEGRSALLLGKAKDNTASAAVGPFIRLFDDGFTMDDVRSATVRLDVEGADGFVMAGESSMRLISRDPLELIAQTLSAHQYPDGFALYLGTMFAPVEDRDAPGRGFTHKIGDRVRVSSDRLGVLENVVVTCDQAPPWTVGVGVLIRNLADRGLLGVSA